MSIDLRSLLEHAFFEEEIQNASESIARALDAYEEHHPGGARTFETVAPESADEAWLRESLVHRLVYFCDSEGAPAPECAGVVVALFVGSRLYAITAQDVIEWAGEALDTSVEQLAETYGTHEHEHA